VLLCPACASTLSTTPGSAYTFFRCWTDVSRPFSQGIGRVVMCAACLLLAEFTRLLRETDRGEAFE
jgi:hypothetical protein